MAKYTKEQAIGAYNAANITRNNKSGQYTFFTWIEGTQEESIALNDTELSYDVTDQTVKDTFIQWLQDNLEYSNTLIVVDSQVVGKV